MAKKHYAELIPGDKIKVFGEKLIVKKIDLSEKGIKKGRTKCRVEAVNEKNEVKVIVRLANELVEVI